MNAAELASQLEHPDVALIERTRSLRARLVGTLGPLTVLAGFVWAVVQPWRITLLHPHGQGFWWLFSEPPLFVALAGLAFHFLVAPALLRDLEQAREEGDG